MSPLEILEKLISFPTVSWDSNLALVQWLAAYLSSQGIKSTLVPSPCGTKAHLYASIGPEVGGGVILSGHTDVVPVDGQTWTDDPWTMKVRNGRIYGRGSCDMKGFDALAIAALVEARNRPLKKPLQLALSYDEELGCIAVTSLVEAIVGHLPRAEAVIVGEPTGMKVVTGQKGSIGLRCVVKGYEVHASIMHRGVSAVMEAARFIQWANDRNAENAARLPAAAGVDFDPPWTTLHVGMIQGGTAPNITAADCEFTIDARVVPGEEVSDWHAAIAGEAERLDSLVKARNSQSGIVLITTLQVPPLVPEADGAAERLTRSLTGDNGTHVVSYGTEGGYFQRAGFSTVICGPGHITQAHQPDEYLEVSQFEEGWQFMLDLLKQLEN